MFQDLLRRQQKPDPWPSFFRRTGVMATLLVIVWGVCGVAFHPVIWIAAIGGGFSFSILWGILSDSGHCRWPGVGFVGFVILMVIPIEWLVLISFNLWGLMFLLTAISGATGGYKRIPKRRLRALLVGGIAIPFLIAGLSCFPGPEVALHLRILSITSITAANVTFTLETITVLKPLPTAF